MKISLKNKPNTNPIQTQSNPILAKKSGWQTQTNPNFILDMGLLGFLSGDKPKIVTEGIYGFFKKLGVILLTGHGK